MMAIGSRDIPIEKFGDHLHELSTELDRVPVLRQLDKPIREKLYAGFRGNFAAGAAANGSVWPPHKPSTIARHGPHPLLILTGALLQSAGSESGPGSVHHTDDRELMVGVKLPYVNVQQYGYPPKNIPPRPYYDQPEQVLDEIEALIADHVAGVIG